MPAHLTAAQARALGIDAPKTGRSRTTRKVARGPYRTVCVDCGAAFTTQAAETRHLDATRHACYQLVLDMTPDVYGSTHERHPGAGA